MKNRKVSVGGTGAIIFCHKHQFFHAKDIQEVKYKSKQKKKKSYVSTQLIPPFTKKVSQVLSHTETTARSQTGAVEESPDLSDQFCN